MIMYTKMIVCIEMIVNWFMEWRNWGMHLWLTFFCV